ncbi:MAG: nucleotidyltransferase family protein [Vulcanisaeta sp.]
MLKIVILTAGLGERLRPLTYLVPKPYLPLRNKLIIEELLDWVTNQGLAYDDIIVVTAYMADKITSILSNVMRNVKFVVADQLLGTAGQLWYVRDLVNEDDDVIVVNGDVLTDISLSKALDFHKSNNAEVTIVSIRYRLTARYGVLDIGPNGEFKGWLEKPVITLPIVTGIYILKGFIIKALRREKLDMNRYIEGLQSVGRKIMVYVADGKYVDLGVPQDYLSALI